MVFRKKIAAALIPILLLLSACGNNEVLGLFKEKGSKIPEVTIVIPQNNLVINSNTLMARGTALDRSGTGLLAVYCSYDSNSFVPLLETTNWSTNLSNISFGTHTIRVYAMDTVSNCSTTNLAVFTYSINPLLTVSAPSNNQIISNTNLTVEGSAADQSGSGLQGVYISLDGNTFSPSSGTATWISNFVFTQSANHTLRIFAEDNATNRSATNTINFYINVDPFIAVTSHSNTQIVYTNGFTLSGTATDNSSTGLATVFLSLDGGTYASVSGTESWSTNFLSLTDMTHTIRIYAMDMSGNSSPTNQISITTILDTISPSATVTSHSDNETVSNLPFTLSGTASDSGTGIDSVYLSIDGGGYAAVDGTTSWSTNISALSNGQHIFSVYSMDIVSNCSTTNQITLEIADFGPYAGLYTIIIANGNYLRISTNGYSSFTSINASGRQIIGCSVDRYRNIYISASNEGNSSGNFGVVTNFSGSISWSGYTSGGPAGICASDDYGNFYAYETTGNTDGIIYSDDFCTNYNWADNGTIGQSGVGVCYVAANRNGYVVLGRSDGSISVRNGGSGTFSEVTPGDCAYGAHQMALTTNASPIITFIESGQYLRSSYHSYARYDLGTNVTALTYHGQRLWIGFIDGYVKYSDNHGQSLSSAFHIGVTEDVTALAVDSQSRIFAGTDEGKLYMSDNTGSSFSSVEDWSGDGNGITQIYIEDW